MLRACASDRSIASAVAEVLESRRLLSGEQEFFLTAASAPETISSAETIGDFYSDPAIYTKFEMVEGEGSEGNMYFRVADRHLKPWMQLDYEVQNVFSIRVRAYDAVGNFVEQIFWLTITDVNEAPTSITLSNNSVSENLPASTWVGDLSGNDPENNIAGFSVVGAHPDNDSFQVVDGKLRTTAIFDYETRNSYSITIRATDTGGLYYDQNFTIAVLDGDDLPNAIDDAADTRGRSRMKINVLANDIDPEGGSLSVTLGTLPTNGSVMLNPDGTFTYYATLGYIGTDSFTYTVQDIAGQTDTGTVNIAVTIPSVQHIKDYGTLDSDTMSLTVVDGILRYQISDFIQQYIYPAALSITLVAFSGEDTVTVDDSVTLGVTVYGGAGNDTLTGSLQADYLLGCNGNDLVQGGLGDDSLNGGGGDDTVIGGEGADLLVGTNGADSLEGSAGNDTIYGGPMVDSIFGGDGDDALLAGADNDLVWGDAGNDVVLGELADDQVWGGAGRDTIRGNFGNDTLWGGLDGDRLYGDLNDDLLNGEEGTDYLNGGPDNDSLFGGGERDRLVGDAGNDFLDGGNNLDSLFGGLGMDQLYGQGGYDELLGGADADYLCGGDGVDTMRGDDGDDEFLCIDAWADHVVGGFGVDKAGVDALDHLFGIETVLA